MKRIMISAFAAVALLAAATTMLRSHSSVADFSVGASRMVSMQELQAAAGANKLPTDDFEDQSLVYSTAPNR